ncbi:MAG: GTP-binding protein [Acetobacteraceae bacterium]
MPDSLLRVLACGSVDDGKSTLIGRLLFECGTIPDDVLAALERDSRRFGTVPGANRLRAAGGRAGAERDQGITIDVAYRFFETPRRRFILADAPGHEQYTRNMVTGASASDLAVLLVDARKGLLVQTRRHAAIASLLGIRQVVLAVNKMDLMGFDQAVFDRIVAAFYGFPRPALAPLSVTAIPVCARDGDKRHHAQHPHALVRGPDAAGRAGGGERPRCCPSGRSACRCSLSRGRTTHSAAMPARSPPAPSGRARRW